MDHDLFDIESAGNRLRPLISAKTDAAARPSTQLPRLPPAPSTAQGGPPSGESLPVLDLVHAAYSYLSSLDD